MFDSLIGQGLYPERFYGNAIQTATAMFSLLCSVLPSCRGKAYLRNPELSLRGLPAILRDHGYDTQYFMTYSDLGFDDTGRFMRQIGFRETHSMDSTFVTPEDQPFIWGWGLQDDRFYRKVFDSSTVARRESRPGRSSS